MNLPFRFGTAVKVSIFLFFYILAICLLGTFPTTTW